MHPGSSTNAAHIKVAKTANRRQSQITAKKKKKKQLHKKYKADSNYVSDAFLLYPPTALYFVC